jgi:hypothetical protein
VHFNHLRRNPGPQHQAFAIRQLQCDAPWIGEAVEIDRTVDEMRLRIDDDAVGIVDALADLQAHRGAGALVADCQPAEVRRR